MVLLHGCRIEAQSLIGNGAIVLDGARVGTDCIVAAGSLVPPRMVVPDIAQASAHYVKRSAEFRQRLRPMET
jgi:carbonic anhydrase/acetyltransferase-like protein (isoleucine patch superfamily)